MDIPKKNLGLPGDDEISVVNLKCDTRLIGSFREEPGIFPGWHMNKAHWLSVALDGTADDEKIKFLADMSYELTNQSNDKRPAIAGLSFIDRVKTTFRQMPESYRECFFASSVLSCH